MSQRAFDDVERLLTDQVGLRLDPALRGRLRQAVRDEADKRGQRLKDYVAALDVDAMALQDLLNRVTVQETAFFRDPGQFMALASHVLPALRDTGQPVRVWSAGCANGQEPYSIAMALSESGIGEWEVVATDVSTDALARTRAGVYAERELRGLNDVRRLRHFVAADGDAARFQISDDLRKHVRVVRNNLASDLPPFPPRSCDIVFCRNVLIYFDRATTVALLDRFAEWLPPGGALFLGYSESLWDLSDRFRLVRMGDAFVYRNARPEDSTDHVPVSGSSIVRPVAPPPAAPLEKQDATQTWIERQLADDEALDEIDPRLDATAAESLQEGESALKESSYAEAVTAFRRAVYLDPDNPVAYLHLGIALRATGDDVAARRAYAAGRAALDRCDADAVEALLEGFHIDELTRLLDEGASEP